jgi:hypothetical protein
MCPLSLGNFDFHGHRSPRCRNRERFGGKLLSLISFQFLAAVVYDQSGDHAAHAGFAGRPTYNEVTRSCPLRVPLYRAGACGQTCSGCLRVHRHFGWTRGNLLLLPHLPVALVATLARRNSLTAAANHVALAATMVG